MIARLVRKRPGVGSLLPDYPILHRKGNVTYVRSVFLLAIVAAFPAADTAEQLHPGTVIGAVRKEL